MAYQCEFEKLSNGGDDWSQRSETVLWTAAEPPPPYDSEEGWWLADVLAERLGFQPECYSGPVWAGSVSYVVARATGQTYLIVSQRSGIG